MDTELTKQTTVSIRRRHQPDIYVPRAFTVVDDKGAPRPPIFRFKAYEIRYLDGIHRGMSHEKAAAAAGLDDARARRVLGRSKAKEYLADLTRQKMAVEGLSQDWFLNELRKVWYGEKVMVSREQMDAIKEIGARICPKPEKAGAGGSGAPVIQITINKIESALKRQESIEAQVINGTIGSAGAIPPGLQEKPAFSL